MWFVELELTIMWEGEKRFVWLFKEYVESPASQGKDQLCW